MELFKVLILIGIACASAKSTEVDQIPEVASNISSVVRYLLEQLVKLGTQAVNNVILYFIEGLRPYFSTGWPLLGIPALDPYVIKDFSTSFDALGSLGAFEFALTDGEVVGLQKFQIKHFYLDILRLSLDFTVFFDQIVLDGNHVSNMKLGIFPVQGKGDIEVILKNVEVRGSIALGTVNGNYLNIDKFELHDSIGSVEAHLTGFGVLDAVVSETMTVALDGLINESLAALNVMITDVFVPSVNAVLNSFNLAEILLAIIAAIVPNSNINV